jgi:hypothetical protein
LAEKRFHTVVAINSVLLFSHIFQRRDAVYKRNYKDYFGFMEGPVREKPAEELTETETGILAWLDKNK